MRQPGSRFPVSVPAALAALCVALCASSVRAHQHWVAVDTFSPAAGQDITVSVCSGHYFPKSALVLKDNVLRSVELLSPGGTSTTVQTAPEGKQRNGIAKPAAEGTHIVCLTLQRPHAPLPSYEARTFLITRSAEDDPARYAVGRGLELVPAKALSQLSPGDELPLFALLDGKRVPAALEVLVEGGRSAFLKTTAEQPALLRITATGRYLATTGIRGRGCSLLFQVRTADKETP